MTNLNEISKQVYEANKLKGFDVKNENIGQTLCLIHSEISEALEAIRKDNSARKHIFLMPKNDLKKLQLNVDCEEEYWKLLFSKHVKDTFEDEIADTFIRLMDLVGALEIDIDMHIELKRRFNSLRPFKNGKAF